jgi:hypothetical protein
MSGLADNIMFGPKQDLGDLSFPCLYILPMTVDNKDLYIPSGQEVTIPFELVIVLKDYELEDGVEETIRLAGSIYDIFYERIGANRKLNGKCWYVDITKIDPGYAKNDEMTVLHWCSLEILAHTGVY